LDIIKKEVSLIMENIISAPIKLTVDIWVWKNWRECK
jgi:DNA polymerase I-like protein with 3'-5' exonuclease and polymerase domains